MIDFSNAKILDLAVHVVGNKSKDEKLVLTDTSSTISNDVKKPPMFVLEDMEDYKTRGKNVDCQII